MQILPIDLTALIGSISRLAEKSGSLRQAVEIAQATPDQVALVEKIYDAFKHYHPIHTNNNAALCAAACRAPAEGPGSAQRRKGPLKRYASRKRFPQTRLPSSIRAAPRFPGS